jgi:hypothetical protein
MTLQVACQKHPAPAKVSRFQGKPLLFWTWPLRIRAVIAAYWGFPLGHLVVENCLNCAFEAAKLGEFHQMIKSASQATGWARDDIR